MPSERIARGIRDLTGLLDAIPAQGEDLTVFTRRLVEVFHQGGKLLVIGSGSLSAIADLVATRFLHRLSMERPLLPALSLCHDATLAAALARDGQSSQYFARQLRASTVGGDVVLVFSEESRDEGVVEALAVARQLECLTVVVGSDREEPGGSPPDFLFALPATSPSRLAEGALFFGHLLCELVEGELFGI